MGQVWPKADFDGIPAANNEGGRGSVLAVTAQNPGVDDEFDTSDDILAPLNRRPIDVSMDASSGSECENPDDRVRNFASFHSGGAHFLYGDGGVRFVSDGIDQAVYRGLSTVNGGEVVNAF